MDTKRTSRLAGILILVAYAVLGSGNPNQKLLGMTLEVTSGLAVVGIALLMFPLFKPRSPTIAYSYLFLRAIEGSLLVASGLLFLSNSSQLLSIRDAIYLGHGYIFSLAAFGFYYLLYQTKLIPRFISVWGVIASILVIAVNITTLTGLTSELLILFLPIITNEFFLALWLILKGFNSTPTRK